MTTPQEFFDAGAFNPEIGLRVRDWYAIGSAFLPQPIQHNDGVIVAARNLLCSDVASYFMMDFEIVARQTDATQAGDIIPMLERVFDKYGKPTHGVIVSHSVWVSSDEMASDEDMVDRGADLQSVGVSFDAMSETEKRKLEQWIIAQGVRCEFDANNVF